VICGCDEDHACAPDGCSWTDESKRICDRHPPEDVATARLVLAREAREPEHISKPIARVLTHLAPKETR
jgi:hypothetical protein